MYVLHNINIHDETSCLVLADIIRNKNNIKEVYLRENKIGYEGTKAISDTLKNNRSLETLVRGSICISRCFRTKEVFEEVNIGDEVNHLSLEDLSMNKISAE